MSIPLFPCIFWGYFYRAKRRPQDFLKEVGHFPPLVMPFRKFVRDRSLFMKGKGEGKLMGVGIGFTLLYYRGRVIVEI